MLWLSFHVYPPLSGSTYLKRRTACSNNTLILLDLFGEWKFSDLYLWETLGIVLITKGELKKARLSDRIQHHCRYLQKFYDIVNHAFSNHHTKSSRPVHYKKTASSKEKAVIK